MTSYIPKLARMASGHGAGRKRSGDPNGEGRANARVNVASIASSLPQIRHRLKIGPSLSDDALLASLVAIASHPSHEERWRAAEASTLGQHLATGGKDKRETLGTLLSLLPKPYL